MGRTGYAPRIAVVSLVLLGVRAAAQVPFEQAVADLSSPDPGARLKAVAVLKDAAYPEAAVPLARLITDAQDAIQFEAIAAELNISLAEKVVTRKRVGLVLEKRNAITAEATFSAGPLAVSGQPAPMEVGIALVTAMRDDNPRVGLEAIYAFGVIAPTIGRAARGGVLGAAGPQLSGLLGVADPFLRYAAARVIGRVFARRAQDPPVDESVGDALISAMNDGDRAVRAAAIQSLGTMRYDRAVAALDTLFAYHGKGEQAEGALDALAHIANPASAQLFEAQLLSKTTSVRGIAAEGLARLGDAARLANLQSTLKSERGEGVVLALAFANTMLANAPVNPISEAVTRSRLREQARNYLVEIAPGRAGLFIQQVLDPDSRVRLAAVDALGLSADPSALVLVQSLAGDPDPLVARAAAHAIERLMSPR